MESNAPISAENLRQILHGNKINVRRIETVSGPTVTLYKIFPEPGTRVSKIRALETDMSLAVLSPSIRIIIMGDCIGLEVANFPREEVSLDSLLTGPMFSDVASGMKIPLVLGMKTDRSTCAVDLAGLPHLLVVGSEAEEKSLMCHAIVMSIKDACDRGNLRLSAISGDEHAQDPETAIEQFVAEMEDRYEILGRSGCRDISAYHKMNPHEMPYEVILMEDYDRYAIGATEKAKKILRAIIRLACKGRPVGMHLIIVTSKITNETMSGLLKANFTARLAGRTSSRSESLLVLDVGGAEKLTGFGDCLFESGCDIQRIQMGRDR